MQLISFARMEMSDDPVVFFGMLIPRNSALAPPQLHYVATGVSVPLFLKSTRPSSPVFY